MISVYIILFIFILCAVCILITVIQTKRVNKYKTENQSLHLEVNEAVKNLSRMKELLSKNKAAEGKANEQRQELAETKDNDLVNRANGLFTDGGMR